MRIQVLASMRREMAQRLQHACLNLKSQAPLGWLMDVNRQALIYVHAFGACFSVLMLLSHSKPDNYETELGTILHAAAAFAFCAGIVVAVLAPRFNISAEKTWAAEVMAFAGARFAAGLPLMFDIDAEFRQRSFGVGMVVWKCLVVVLEFPNAHSALYLVWAIVNDVFNMFVCHRLWGDTISASTFALSAVWAFGIFACGVVTQKRRHDQHKAHIDLAADKVAMKDLLDIICDFTVLLRGLDMRVMKADKRLDHLLDDQLEGSSLLCHLRAPEEERERVHEGLMRARQAPVLLPITFTSANDRQYPADAFIVKHSSTEDSDIFLIGCKLGEGANCEATAYASPAADLIEFESEFGEGRGSLSAARPASIPSTTMTGRVFSDLLAGLRHEAGVRRELMGKLQSIADLGEEEHWLLPSTSVCIRPSRVLGSGGFGVVFVGLFQGAAVAIKVSRRSENNPKANHLASIGNELRILRQVRHPNIIQFFGACISPLTAELALVLEWARGPTLRVFVNGSRSTVDRVRLLLGVGSALVYLHSLQPPIIHGDLKACNVIVEEVDFEVRAKLLDFGLARLITKRRRPLGGSLRWMAPEVHNGSLKPQASADVFSFGRLLYFLVTSIEPLKGMTAHTIHLLLKQEQVPPLTWTKVPLAEEAKDLSDACLQKTPSTRPSMEDAQATMMSWRPPEIERQMFDGPPWLCVGSQAQGVQVGNFQEARRQADSDPKGINELESGERRAGKATHAKQFNRRLRNNILPAIQEQGKNMKQSALRLPHLNTTTDKGMLLTLMMTMQRWNFQLPPDSCCSWHASLSVLGRLFKNELSTQCTMLFDDEDVAAVHQCHSCGVLSQVDENEIFSDEAGSRCWNCDACGSKNRCKSGRRMSMIEL